MVMLTQQTKTIYCNVRYHTENERTLLPFHAVRYGKRIDIHSVCTVHTYKPVKLQFNNFYSLIFMFVLLLVIHEMCTLSHINNCLMERFKETIVESVFK